MFTANPRPRWRFLPILCVVVFIFVISCSRTSDNDAAKMGDDAAASSVKKSYSPKARRFLSGFEAALNEQGQGEVEKDVQPEVDEEERLLQLAINQTLDMLLSLSPGKDGRRIGELSEDLKGMGPKASHAIVQMLGEERPVRHRKLLLMALSAFDDERAANALYDGAVKSDDRGVRAQAMASLRDGSTLKNASVKKALMGRALADIKRSGQAAGGDGGVKYQRGAVAVLGALGGDGAVDEIAGVLRVSDDAKLRKEAVASLGSIGSDSAVSVLYEVLDSDEGLRMEAAKELGGLRDEEIELEFGRLLVDKESPADMKLAAVTGLGADNSPLAREILIKALMDKNQPRKVHETIAGVLASGFGEANRGEIASYVKVFEKTPIEYLPQMMQQLMARGGDEAVDLLASKYMEMKTLKRIHAIRSIGRVGSEHAFETLMVMMQREADASLQRELLSVMRRFKGESYEESVVKLLKVVAQTSKDGQSRIAALKYLGEVSPEESSALASELMLSAKDKDVVLVSIDVLKRYGTSENSGALNQLASISEHDDVVKRAEVAMNEIDAREAR